MKYTKDQKTRMIAKLESMKSGTIFDLNKRTLTMQLKPELNKIYRCTKSFTHPNLGRMLNKGQLYKCMEAKNDNINQLVGLTGRGGACCDIAFFNTHFEEANNG